MSSSPQSLLTGSLQGNSPIFAKKHQARLRGGVGVQGAEICAERAWILISPCTENRPLGSRHAAPGGVKRHRVRGQAIVEFTIVLPILMIVLLAAVDFGRLMQARVTAESATRAGASWGAGILANATQGLAPLYMTAPVSGVKCGYGPTCNIEARACDEASGFPGYSGGPLLYGAGSTPIAYHDCAHNYAASTNVIGGVCNPSATQSNPFLEVYWRHPDGAGFVPSAFAPAGVGDTIEVVGTYCFKTLIPWPAVPSQVMLTTSSRYTIQP